MDEHQKAIETALQTQKPKDVVLAFLLNSSKELVQNVSEKLVAEEAVYTSLNFDQNSPELQQIEPWAGTRVGRQIFIDTFSNVGTYWNVDDFQVSDMIAEGNLVAVFGQFTYTSVFAKRTFTSPFSIKAVVEDGLITYFQFMEDTYASAASFRVDGHWVIQQTENETFIVGK